MAAKFAKKGIQISFERSGRSLNITATKGKEVVGRASFHIGDDFVEADDLNGDNSLWVSRDYRRLGIATAMYQMAEKVAKKPIIPSEHRSGDGDAFWNSFVKTLPEDHEAREWLG